MADDVTVPPTVPPPALPDTVALEARLKELEAEKARLEAHKVKMDRDAENLRKKVSDHEARAEALRKLALGDEADKGVDPREILAKREEEARQRSLAALQFQASLGRGLIAAGVLPKDNDVDLLEYRISRMADLKAFADAGDTASLIEALKAKGYVTAPTTAAPPPAPAPAPRPAAPNLQTMPTDPRFDGVETFGDLAKLGFAVMNDFRTKYPERYTELEARSRAAFAAPRRHSPGPMVLGDGTGPVSKPSTFQQFAAAAPAAKKA